MTDEMTREQKSDAIAEGVALAIFNDEGVRSTLAADVRHAILHDCGYQPQDAVAVYRVDPHDFVWLSCAALAVRDRLWHLWGMGESIERDVAAVMQSGGWGGGVKVDHLDLARRTLASVCGYDDVVLWQSITRSLMPSADVMTEYAKRAGIIDKEDDDGEEA